MAEFQSLRGTHDVLPEEISKWQYAEQVLCEISENHGYREIRIPVIEKTALFQRSVGETTDVVQKEMYTFEKGDESITLRPEGTAGTCRMILENGMLNDGLPVKVYCPDINCYRYERPQAGRYREFHQFNLECFGAASPMIDAEMIAMVAEYMSALEIKGVEVHINTIGCPKCRPAYNKKLVEYFTAHKAELCETCLDRLERNPLRLLDCKEEGCQPIKAGAPQITDHLCEECDDHFKGLKEGLEIMGIEYSIDPGIVRGLDYYTRTVFEVVTTQIGAQGTIVGGGRYDGLLEELGGPSTPGIGFAMGKERLIMVMEACGAEFPPVRECDLYIGSTGRSEALVALELAQKLRQEGFYVLTDVMERSVRAQMKYANKQNAAFSCILGSNEIEQGTVEIRNMKTGETKQVRIDALELTEFLWEQMEVDIIDTEFEAEDE